MNKKNAVILCSKNKTFSQKALIQSLATKRFKITIIDPKNFALEIPMKSTPPDYLFHRSLGPFFDDFDLRVSEYFSSLGSKIINPIATIKILRNKAEQALFFNSHHLPIIPTYFLRGKFNHNHFSNWCDDNKFSSSSFVLKTERGHGGIGTFKVNGLDSLSSLWETINALRDERFIIQPYLSKISEFRLFIIRGDIFICAKKGEAHIELKDFRQNANRILKNNKWKKISPPKIPQEIVKLATAIAGKCPAHYLGVDLFWDKKSGVRLIECNASASFQELQKLTLSSISDQIINTLDDA